MGTEEITAPEWVPPQVLAMANHLADLATVGPPEMPDLLCRLITDIRMKSVWQDLGKHKRDDYVRTSDKFYRTELPSAVQSWKAMAEAWRQRAAEYRELGDDANAAQYENFASAVEADGSPNQPDRPNGADRHGLALALLFALTVSLYNAGLNMVARTELERRINSLKASGRPGVADAFARQALDPENARFLVTRKRADQRIHAFVEGLAKEMRLIFGQDMPRIIATITNVAFERSDYDRDRIRALLKVRPPPD